MVDNSPGEVASGLASWLNLLPVVAGALALYALYVVGRMVGRKEAQSPPSGENAVVVEAAGRAGLIAAYPNREVARTDIVAAVRIAAVVKILSNKGDEWLSSTGMIVAPLTERAAAGDRVPVKILLLHVNSPWLLGRAAEKGFWTRGRDQIVTDFEAAHARVLACRPTPETEPPHFHRHDPSWRFIMTDKEIFLQTYATTSQIEKEVVLRLSNQSPIYASASRYFDYVYEFSSAEKNQISLAESLKQKTLLHECSAGLIVTRDQGGRRHVLVLRQGDEFWLSKGGLKEGESPTEAAERELEEETGVSVGGAAAQFVQSVLVGQPFPDSASVKVILFYHLHVTHDFEILGPASSAAWADAEGLMQWTPRYPYVPEVLQKVGVRPREWRSPKFLSDDN
jgi:ADP-ribose pyrophosphatase YjhB (NUDIX family)